MRSRERRFVDKAGATPGAIVTIPSEIVPSRKLTVPVAPVGTVAVNVMLLPTNAGLSKRLPRQSLQPCSRFCERTEEEAAR